MQSILVAKSLSEKPRPVPSASPSIKGSTLALRWQDYQSLSTYWFAKALSYWTNLSHSIVGWLVLVWNRNEWKIIVYMRISINFCIVPDNIGKRITVTLFQDWSSLSIWSLKGLPMTYACVRNGSSTVLRASKCSNPSCLIKWVDATICNPMSSKFAQGLGRGDHWVTDHYIL